MISGSRRWDEPSYQKKNKNKKKKKCMAGGAKPKLPFGKSMDGYLASGHGMTAGSQAATSQTGEEGRKQANRGKDGVA